MEDLLARVGLVLSHLIANSTIHGPQKEEAERLAAELQAFPGSINSMVEERVRAHVEAVQGRVDVLEEGKRKADFVVFSNANLESLEANGTDEEELANIRRTFGRPDKFDRDGDGAPGGSMPAPPTDNPDEMTIAMAEAWLDERGVDRTGVTKRDDLRALVRKEQARPQHVDGANEASQPESGGVRSEG